MSILFTYYSVVLAVAAFISALVVGVSWRRWAIPGGKLFTLMMFSTFLWTFAAMWESAAVEIYYKVAFAKLSFIGTMGTGPLFLFFTLRNRDSVRRITPLHAGLVCALPAASAILAATNELHHLIWTDVIPSPVAGSNMVQFIHTPVFYIAIVYEVLLSVGAAIILVRTVLREYRVFQYQTLIILASLAVFWVGFVLYVIPFTPLPGLDTAAVSFSISGLLLLVGLLRFRLLEIVPVARGVLVEKMADGVIVLDNRDLIVDINPTARDRFGLDGSSIGRSFRETFPSWSERLAAAGDQTDLHLELTHPGDETVFYDLLASPLHDRRGGPAGRLLVVRDVTERRRTELEKEKLIVELRDALADIKALSGLLPICASCKKIRDDTGYWQGLEKYISAHSEAQFSHGLCPECARKLYPGLLDKGGAPTSR